MIQFKKPSIGILELILIGIIAILLWNNHKNGQQYNQLKELVISTDSIVRVNSGHYKKIVDDTQSSREIMKDLKVSNNEMYTYLKEIDKDPIILTQTEVRFYPVKDTTDINQDNTFELNYPNKAESFIKYYGEVDHNKVFGSWEFEPLSLDLVITEKTPGLFEANLMGNKWVQVSSLKVKSLPLSNIKPKTFNWKAGMGVWQSVGESGVDFYGGIRLKKLDILTRFQMNGKDSQVGGFLLYNF